MSLPIYGYKARYKEYFAHGKTIDQCLDKIYQRYLKDDKVTKKLDEVTFICRIQSDGLKVYPDFNKPEGKSVLRFR